MRIYYHGFSGQNRELEVNPHRKADPHSVLHEDKTKVAYYGNVSIISQVP